MHTNKFTHTNRLTWASQLRNYPSERIIETIPDEVNATCPQTLAPERDALARQLVQGTWLDRRNPIQGVHIPYVLQ